MGTAHGNSLENLLINPTLSDLVGGIESVTLSDEEARRRGTQKSVLERRAPPTFDVLIEIQDRQRMAVHHNVAAAVDAILRGRSLQPEIRFRDDGGQVRIEKVPTPVLEPRPVASDMGRLPFEKRGNGRAAEAHLESAGEPPAQRSTQTLRIYPYGVGRGRLVEAARNLGVNIAIVEALDQANAVITLKNYYRKHPQPIADAERRRVPVYVLRANTINQAETCLGDIFGVPVMPKIPSNARLRRRRRRFAGCCQVQPQRICGRPTLKFAVSSTRWRARPTWFRTATATNRGAACASSPAVEWACSLHSKGRRAAARPPKSDCWPSGWAIRATRC